MAVILLGRLGLLPFVGNEKHRTYDSNERSTQTYGTTQEPKQSSLHDIASDAMSNCSVSCTLLTFSTSQRNRI
jgi:hypothetical protein